MRTVLEYGAGAIDVAVLGAVIYVAVHQPVSPPLTIARENDNQDNTAEPVDKNERFRKLVLHVRDARKEKTLYRYGMYLGWEDIQCYTNEQIDRFRMEALPKEHARPLSGIQFLTATLEDASKHKDYEITDFNEEAAYRIMNALLYPQSSLSLNTGNAKILKAMAPAQRDSTGETLSGPVRPC